jgi:hypothetical protein
MNGIQFPTGAVSHSMRYLLLSALLTLFSCNLRAQFSTSQLRLRFGYNVHNTLSRSVNHLIDEFNNDRYPHIIAGNMPSVTWPMGFLFGVDYAFREDMIFYGTIKNRRRFISVPYTDHPNHRQYFFRAHTLEAGMMIPLRDEDFFNHYIGGGLLLGVMGAYTAWVPTGDYGGARNMINIDNSGILGLSVAYEAQFRLHYNLRIYLKPVAQFALNTPIRRLSEFFDPRVTPTGDVYYGPGEGDKYDKASFNGLGIEGGLLFLLPEL